MNNHIHKIAIYAALMLTSSLLFSLKAGADTEKKSNATPSISTDKTSEVSKQKVLAEKKQQIVNEAKDSLSGTQQALLDLEKNDSKAARAILEEVLAKLDILLAEHPSMDLVSADIEVDIFDFEGDAKSLEKVLKQAKTLLDHGELQGARQLLAELASELRITKVSIPLGTYPSAIKDAIAKIEAENNLEAELVLNTALNTLVEDTEVIPLPVLRAEALLTKASDLAHKEDMSKENNRAEVAKYIDAAKEKLKIAELLGYGSKADYQPLYRVIDDIKNEERSQKIAAEWDKVKQTLTVFKNKLTQTKK